MRKISVISVLGACLALGACAIENGVAIPYTHVKPNRPNPMVAGNYCGPGTRYGTLSTTPANVLDAACRQHDACYIAGIEHCTCDRALHDAAKVIEENPTTSGKLRTQARATRLLFSTRYCEMFPRGIFRPRDKSILLTLPAGGPPR